MDEYIVGVDVGSSKVCASAGKYDKQGKLQIVGVATSLCNGLNKYKVIDIDNTAESIKNSIEQLERIACTKITKTYVSIPVAACELIKNKAVVEISGDDRKIKKIDMERAMKAVRAIPLTKEKEIIGVLPEKYIVDGHDSIEEPLGMSGLRLELDANVVVAESEVLDSLFKCFEKLGIEICGFAIQPLVTSQVVLNNDELNSNTLLVDIGAEEMDISFFEKDKISHINAFPIGGNSITSDISICLKLSLMEAEKLKIKYGSLYAESDSIKVTVNDNNSEVEVDCNLLTDIIKARVEEMLKIIKLIVEKNDINESFSSIVIIGGGISYFKGIGELCANVFCKPTRIGMPDFIGAASPIYANAVGIVNDVYLSNKTIVKYKDESNGLNVINKDEKVNNNSRENGFISKLKDFFTDFF